MTELTAEMAEERRRQEVSMNRLAEITGMGLTTISYFERGERFPTLDTVIRISVALNFDIGAALQRTFRKKKLLRKE